MPHLIQSKTILNKAKTRDSWFLDSYTINPYSGCSFNCLFCYIRGSKYGEHMETKLSAKENAVELLEKQLSLRAKKGEYGIIVMSSATDPYLQFEKEYQLTRRLLEVILKYRFPVHIITRSSLVERDFDLIKEIEEKAILPDDLVNCVPQKSFITFSFSTIDDHIASIFEPGATPPSLRLKTLQKSIEEGFHSGVSLMPLLPYITDTGEHLSKMFGAFQSIDVKYILPATLTLFGTEKSDSKTLVFRTVEKYYPELLPKYQKLFHNSDELPAFYRSAFHKKMKELGEEFNLSLKIASKK